MGQLLGCEEVARRGVRAHRSAQWREDAHHFSLVARFAPRLDGRRGQLRVLRPAGRRRDLRVGQLAGRGGRGQGVPLVRSHAHQLHPAVAASHHAHGPVAAAVASQHDAVVVEAAEAGAVQGQLGLLDGHVDALPGAGTQAVVHRPQRGHRRVPTGVVVGQVATDLDGRPVGEELPARPARQDRSFAARVKGDEVVGAVAGVGAGEAERRDDDHGGRWVELLGPGPPTIVGDEDVTGSRQPLEIRSPVGPVGHDRARLAGVQVQEPTAWFGGGRVGPARPPLAGRVPSRRFHLHHVGAQVRQHLGAERGRNPIGDLQHPPPVQCPCGGIIQVRHRPSDFHWPSRRRAHHRDNY